MSISYRTALLAATVVLSVPLLSACSDETDHDVRATASPTETVVMDAEAKAGVKFAKDYRELHPKLAKDREDQDIVNDGDATCDLFEDDDANRADVIGEVSDTFAANGVKPNDETAIKIMTLAVQDLCPSRIANLKAAL